MTTSWWLPDTVHLQPNVAGAQSLCGSCQMIFYGLRRFLISSPLLFSSEMMMEIGEEAKKSWNYDDLIRKVRNNEGFLMRNFPPHPMRASHSPFATVNWSELLCFYCAVPYIIHQRSLWSEKKKLNEEEEEGKNRANWKRNPSSAGGQKERL